MLMRRPMAGDAHELPNDPCRPDHVVDHEVLAVETVLDVGVLALDVAEQVPVALARRGRPVQLARWVTDHVVDNIVGESRERACDVAVRFPAEVVLDDLVDRLPRETGGCGHCHPLPVIWLYQVSS
jgi:hypothetical protein